MTLETARPSRSRRRPPYGKARAGRVPPRGAPYARLIAIAVIIPAHDEQSLLGACLDAVASAAWHARHRGLLVETIVVADACTDATRAIARARGAAALTANDNDVAAARAAGAAHALDSAFGDRCPMTQLYLLHADADTRVPCDWITRHVDAAADHDAVLGPVEVDDRTSQSESCAQRFRTANALETDRHRVHGANLGVRADAYLRVGAFSAPLVAEDRTLAEALRAAGESVAYRRDLVVSASAQASSGRVRGNFSDYPSELDRATARPSGGRLPP